MPPEVEVQSLNCWTTREVLIFLNQSDLRSLSFKRDLENKLPWQVCGIAQEKEERVLICIK